MKHYSFTFVACLTCLTLSAAAVLAAPAPRTLTAVAPSERLSLTVDIADDITYAIALDGQTVLAPSRIAMKLSGGEEWGVRPRLRSHATRRVHETIATPFYRSNTIDDAYTLLTLNFAPDWGLEFRVYDDGVAYRFVSKRKKAYTIEAETVVYRFERDYTARVPYTQVGTDGDRESQFHSAFEARYDVAKLSGLRRGRLILLPMVVELDNGRKVLLSEADLENYPGMYLQKDETEANILSSVYAPYPKSEQQGGHNNLQMRVVEREPYIAKVDGARTFPWRFAVVTTTDRQLASTTMSYKLGAPSRIADTSWIQPGKVAWDWWNDWNIEGVDFRAGINNATYKYYIDFAAKSGIEYVILDEGWNVRNTADLMQVIPDINIKELVDYGKARGVGIVLWAGYHAFNRDMENVCRHYAEMGVRGFKVDFMDRDDQPIVEFITRAAETAAKYHLFLDMHGMYKPGGLNRTYPNLLNFEGVYGLENMKWAEPTIDQMKYDVSIPFIRQAAGPLDYTQGAMHNATRANYAPSNTEPMSQGTRCHQLAMYVVYDSPFNMLCDAPTNYEREPESLAFIADVPTVWDETRILDGRLGEYIITARRKGTTWYVGGMTDWTPRDLVIDCSFLDAGNYRAVLFKDGVNADRRPTDYRRTAFTTERTQKLTIHVAPGGGFALKMESAQ